MVFIISNQHSLPHPVAATPDWVDEELAALLDELEGKKSSAQVDSRSPRINGSTEMHGTVSPI